MFDDIPSAAQNIRRIALTVRRGAINKRELHALLEGTVMLRRHKVDVQTQLPPKHVSVVRMPVSACAQAVCVTHRAQLDSIAARTLSGELPAAEADRLRQAQISAFYRDTGVD